MLRAFVTIGVLQLLGMVIQLARTKSLALLLGPEQVGVMAVTDKLLAVIVQTVSLSLPFAAIRFLPERWSAGPAAFVALFRRMFVLLLGLALAATAVALGVSAVAPATWGRELLPYRWTVAAGLLTMPVLALVPFLQNAMAGRLQQTRSMLIAVAHAVVMALAALAGILWHGLTGYYVCYAVLGVALASLAYRAVTDVPATPPAPPEAAVLPPAIWRFAAALLVLTFVTPYAALFVHYRVLTRFGPDHAGWMQAAMGVAIAVRTVLGAGHAVFLTPQVNRGGTPAERMARASDYQHLLCGLAAVAVPPLLLFPELVVRMLYAASFAPAAPFLVLFVAAEVLGLLAATYQTITVSLDHMRFHVVSNILAQAALVGAAALLVTGHGIAGAGLAALVAPALLLVASTTFLRREHGLRVPPRTIVVAGATLAFLAVAGWVGTLGHAFTPSGVGLRLATWGAGLAGAALLLTPDERARVAGLAARARRRLVPSAS